MKLRGIHFRQAMRWKKGDALYLTPAIFLYTDRATRIGYKLIDVYINLWKWQGLFVLVLKREV
jgi:hypothetical protein